MKITAPDAKNLRGEHKTAFGPLSVTFKDGVAEVDDDQVTDGIRGYLLHAGYGLDGGKPTQPEPQVPAIDARDAAEKVTVGTELRDAAVDPAPDDFLPPVNAGEADPHGPLVVAPGIHAEGERVVAAGPVSSDPAVQSENEQRLAEKLLVDGEKVGVPSGVDWKEGTGPLGLSDPLSAAEGVEKAKAAAPAVEKAEGEPAGNASREEWATFATSQGAPDDETAEGGLSRNDLRAKYGS